MQLPLNKKHRHRDDACSTSAAAYGSSNEWRWCFQVLADTWDRRAGRGWSSGSYLIIRPGIDRLTPPLSIKKRTILFSRPLLFLRNRNSPVVASIQRWQMNWRVSVEIHTHFSTIIKNSRHLPTVPFSGPGDAVALLLVSARNMKASAIKEPSLSEVTFLLN